MSASDTLIVELARIKALVIAMESVVSRTGDLKEVDETCGWLRVMATDDLERLKAGLDTTVMNIDT